MSTQLVVIKTFMYAHESGVCASLLESEGIPTALMNEHAVQAVSVYSNALGGVKLMVPADQYDLAVQILVQHGLMVMPNNKVLKIPFDSLTANWPVFKKLNPMTRFILLMLFVISVLAVILFFIFN
jgi:type III secretory pathway lipoprotein EscJ